MNRVTENRRHRRSSRTNGFTLLELMVVAVIISILFALAISKLLSLRVDAERVSMENVAGPLRSALGIKVAESVARQNLRALPSLEGSNPMDRLAEVPANYLGELSDPDVA